MHVIALSWCVTLHIVLHVVLLVAEKAFAMHRLSPFNVLGSHSLYTLDFTPRQSQKAGDLGCYFTGWPSPATLFGNSC